MDKYIAVDIKTLAMLNLAVQILLIIMVSGAVHFAKKGELGRHCTSMRALVPAQIISIAAVYQKNPAVIDNFPIDPNKQPESVVTASPEPKSTSQIPSSIITNETIKASVFNLQIFGTTRAGKP